MAARRSPVTMMGRLRAQSADLGRYNTPGVGARLARYDSDRIGVDGRLPNHYRSFYNQWRIGPLEFIHIDPPKGRYVKDNFGRVVSGRVANVPMVYPDAFHNGLWGGEGVIKGERSPFAVRHQHMSKRLAKPYYWFPELHETVVYSEILDKYIAMDATERGEMLVDRHHGFDFYLLETPVNEVYAKMLLLLKRQMLLRLNNEEELYPNDSVKRAEVLDKYKQFCMPQEEADWHGLTIDMARQKQRAIERRQDAINTVPKRIEYQKELLHLLKEGYLDDLDPQLLYEDELSEGKHRGSEISKAFKSITRKIKLGID